MRTSQALLLVSILAACSLAAKDLPLVGQLPALPPEWKLREDGKYGETSFRWDWAVFTNAQGDILSFASHRMSVGEERQVIYFSDSPRELL
jgi:hypothetical protein